MSGRQAPLGLDHLASHRGLVSTPATRTARPPFDRRRFDAIIVPAARPGLNLLTAAAVARRAGHELVVLCSRRCRPDQAKKSIRDARPEVPWTVVDLKDYAFPLPFECDALARRDPTWRCDTGVKRNLGLALAAVMGWESVLFLDDDVREFRRHQLSRALAGLRAGFHVVGWTCTNYPDNSIACHAYRLADPAGRAYGRQDTFVGAGALAVSTDRPLSFFPSVYNEDWLFLYDLLQQPGAVAQAGRVRQLRFDPFGDPRHAENQEFGEVLGEGHFRLLHLARAGLTPDPDALATSPDYWRGVIAGRQRFLDEITAGLWARGESRALSCLEVSRATLNRIRPERAADWAAARQRDVAYWQAFIDLLRAKAEGGSGPERWQLALDVLHLRERSHRTEPPTRMTRRLRAATAVRNWWSGAA